VIPRVLVFGVTIGAVFLARRGVSGVLVCIVDLCGRGAWVGGWCDAGVDGEDVNGAGVCRAGIGDVAFCCLCACGGSVSDGDG